MKGWMFEEVGKPLVLFEKPDPVATEGNVVIEVKACGTCHSDVDMLYNEAWRGICQPNTYFGHEVAGVIIDVADDVTNYKVGDRVAIGQFGVGFLYDGGFSDKCLVPADHLVKIPDSVDFIQAAAGTDAGATAYHGVVTQGCIKEGMKVGIIGVGGLGHVGLQIAKAYNCEVYACELKEEARQLALELGAKEVVSDVKDFAPFELDLIIDFCSTGSTLNSAIEVINNGGRIVEVGGMAHEGNISLFTLRAKQLTIVGSLGSNVNEIAGTYKLMDTHGVKIIANEFKFEDVPKAIDRLRDGGVVGRLVCEMDK